MHDDSSGRGLCALARAVFDQLKLAIARPFLRMVFCPELAIAISIKLELAEFEECRASEWWVVHNFEFRLRELLAIGH